MRNRRARRRAAQGCCVRCPRPTRPGLTMCQPCADWFNAYVADRRAKLHAAGRCILCGRARGVACRRRTRCRRCLDADRARLRVR